MAKYQAYAEYKDSGVGFLGEIPEHWIVSKVKYLAPFQVGWTPPTKNDSNFIGDNLWVNISDLKGKVINNTVKQISDKAALEASMDITPKGSLMYSFKLSVGTVSFAGCDMYTNEAIASFLHSAKLPLSYLYYALPKFVIENASTNIYGANILNQELIRNALLVKIPYIEAEKIANFLDHETAKIDHLIEKQQQLIELLKEKRQAVISHAVTKGLDPNVPMKDSGVEWLGQVPEHWTILKLSAIADITRLAGYEYTEYWQSDDEGEIIAIRGQNIRFNKLVNLDDAEKITNKLSIRLKRSRLYKNDIAYPCVGTIGNAVLIHESDKYHINQNIAKLTPNEKIYPLYLTYFLNSSICLESALFLNTSDAQPSILVGNLRKVKIAFPQLAEQIKIADSISNQLFMLDNLILKAELTISLMQERRTALISAAVTGKIDVRNWQAPTVAEADTELSA